MNCIHEFRDRLGCCYNCADGMPQTPGGALAVVLDRLEDLRAEVGDAVAQPLEAALKRLEELIHGL